MNEENLKQGMWSILSYVEWNELPKCTNWFWRCSKNKFMCKSCVARHRIAAFVQQHVDRFVPKSSYLVGTVTDNSTISISVGSD